MQYRCQFLETWYTLQVEKYCNGYYNQAALYVSQVELLAQHVAVICNTGGNARSNAFQPAKQICCGTSCKSQNASSIARPWNKNVLFHRIIKLTKLPRKIVQGGEPMQVNDLFSNHSRKCYAVHMVTFNWCPSLSDRTSQVSGSFKPGSHLRRKHKHKHEELMR
jgi:hypothetical protein